MVLPSHESSAAKPIRDAEASTMHLKFYQTAAAVRRVIRAVSSRFNFGAAAPGDINKNGLQRQNA